MSGILSPQRRATGRLVLARLALMIGSVVLLIAGVELVTRWIGPATPFLLIPSPRNCLRRSGTLSLDFRPNCQGVLSETPFRTNTEGLRGPALREDGARRILVLGDSCTWGWHVREEESYPGVLQRLLDARPNGPRYDVINAGVPGYTSYQGLVTMQEKGVALQPSVVIAGFGWNDASLRGDIRKQIELENRYLRLIQLDDWLLEQSRFYRWARARVDENAAAAAATESRVAPLQSWENLDRIAALAAEHGAPVLYLNFFRPGTHPTRQRMLAGLAEHWHAPLITYEGPRLDLVHPTVEGYRDLAAQILTALEESGALDPPSR